VLSARVFEEIALWRKDHPKATRKEIEEEPDDRLSGLRAQLLTDLAQQSASRDWSQAEPAQRPRCPHCGPGLQARGEHERRLQTQGGAEVKPR